jgi:hypothetical protein
MRAIDIDSGRVRRGRPVRSLHPVRAIEVLDVVTTVHGHTVKGRFTPATLELRVLTRPWAGRTFASPTDAAKAVAAYFAAGGPWAVPTGATFWRVAGTGQVLRAPVSGR